MHLYSSKEEKKIIKGREGRQKKEGRKRREEEKKLVGDQTNR